MSTERVVYRLGHHIKTNLYRGDDPIGHACDPEDAQMIVTALNMMEQARINRERDNDDS